MSDWDEGDCVGLVFRSLTANAAGAAAGHHDHSDCSVLGWQLERGEHLSLKRAEQ